MNNNLRSRTENNENERFLNILEWLTHFKYLSLDANSELLKKAKNKNIDLAFGYCDFNDYQGLDIDKNLIKLLNLYNIEFTDKLSTLTKEAISSPTQEEVITLKINNQKYEVLSWLGNLKHKGCYTTSNWIDFNTLKAI